MPDTTSAVYPGYVELAEKLVELMGDERMVFFSNSGAESLEGAVKLAMRVTGRSGIIAFKNSFHGRTLTTTALSASSSSYRKGLLGALPPVPPVPFPRPSPTVRPPRRKPPAACANSRRFST